MQRSSGQDPGWSSESQQAKFSSESQQAKDRPAASEEVARGGRDTSHSKAKVEEVSPVCTQHRLRLPAFEWYLGPMYQRCDEILAERAAANTKQVVRKRIVQHVPPEDPWLKHTSRRTPVYKFSSAVVERPLLDQGRVHINVVQNVDPLATPRSARMPLDESGPLVRPNTVSGATPRRNSAASATPRRRQLEPLRPQTTE